MKLNLKLKGTLNYSKRKLFKLKLIVYSVASMLLILIPALVGAGFILEGLNHSYMNGVVLVEQIKISTVVIGSILVATSFINMIALISTKRILNKYFVEYLVSLSKQAKLQGEATELLETAAKVNAKAGEQLVKAQTEKNSRINL